MAHRWCLIANPRSGGGRTAGRIEEIGALARRSLEDPAVWVTEGPGHATALAEAAVAEGYDRVIAVGGDGTANEVINGLFDGDRVRREGVAFGLINAGTGGDLVKTLAAPTAPDAAFAYLARTAPRPIDLIHLTIQTDDGPTERLAVNVVGIGLSGAVVDRANRSSKRFGGRATYLAATVRTLRSDPPSAVRLSWIDADGRPGEWSGALLSAFVANGQYCGGGMWVGRGGAIDDGAADMTLIPALSLPRLILGTPRLFMGTMERVKEVSRVAVRELQALPEREKPVLIDVDGEQPGYLPVSARMLPKALLVIG